MIFPFKESNGFITVSVNLFYMSHQLIEKCGVSLSNK